MSKIAIVGLAVLAAAILVMFLTQPELIGSSAGPQMASFNRELSGSVPLGQADDEVNRDRLIDAQARRTSPETSLHVSDEWMAEQHELSPLSTPQFALPAEAPGGVEVAWAWIERLDPVKQRAVERAFGDAAAALRAGLPKETGLNDAKFEASMAKLEQDVSRRLKSILSPQEFEAYLWSLPDDALERLGYEKSGN